jgi:hypothetical protein
MLNRVSIWGGFVRILTSNVTGNQREIISRAFYPYFSRFFSGTPLDSRYEKWNFESNQSLAFWYLNPTNHSPSCFEFKTNQSYALDLNPTNGKPSLNGQSSTFRCTFVYLKKSFHVLISSSTNVIRFQDCLYYFQICILCIGFADLNSVTR